MDAGFGKCMFSQSPKKAKVVMGCALMPKGSGAQCIEQYGQTGMDQFQQAVKWRIAVMSGIAAIQSIYGSQLTDRTWMIVCGRAGAKLLH
jgi:hypothetical protein